MYYNRSCVLGILICLSARSFSTTSYSFYSGRSSTPSLSSMLCSVLLGAGSGFNIACTTSGLDWFCIIVSGLNFLSFSVSRSNGSSSSFKSSVYLSLSCISARRFLVSWDLGMSSFSSPAISSLVCMELSLASSSSFNRCSSTRSINLCLSLFCWMMFYALMYWAFCIVELIMLW